MDRYGFRACLRKHGWTQRRLAAELEIPRYYVSLLANGKVAVGESLLLRMLEVLQESDPKMLTEDWALMRPLPDDVDHAYHHDDLIAEADDGHSFESDSP